jgi:TBC1 domain family member 8/9
MRYPQCTRLVQVGLPNRLRGELWETLSGSLYLRFANPGVYDQILKDNEGRSSTSTEEIEKDLNRSLPEYAAYQSEQGINTLRRVLTAYSWKNPELGYCQVSRLL